MPKGDKLAPRVRLFVAEYLKDLNAGKAAQRAGYRHPASQGPRLLHNVKVQQALCSAKESLDRRTADIDLSAERILREIALLAYANMEDYTDVEDGKRVGNLTKLNRDQLAAVCEITEDVTGGEGDGERKRILRQRFKLHDKKACLEMLGRYRALFTDKVQHEGTILVDAANRISQGLKRVRS